MRCGRARLLKRAPRTLITALRPIRGGGTAKGGEHVERLGMAVARAREVGQQVSVASGPRSQRRCSNR
jgi:hypothetical protein